jgi:hypothetical protein
LKLNLDHAQLKARAVEASLFPIPNIVRIQSDAEEIGWNETKLRSPDADQTNKHTVRARDDPPLPQFSANQDRRDNRQHAGNVIQPEHGRATAKLELFSSGSTSMKTHLAHHAPDNDGEATAASLLTLTLV